MNLAQVKLFRIKGEIMKRHFFDPMTFNKVVSAIKKEHALEKILTEMGSRHRAKRFQIKINSIEEIESEE
jgi:large subunit ribosomal protein LX